MKKRVLVFAVVLAVCAALMWVAGYNFDERSPFVASSCGLAVAFALAAASFPFDDD